MPEPKVTPGIHLEQAQWECGLQFVGGMDEAGRGAWAGPVMAALVILPPHEPLELTLSGVRDSKQMTPRQRTRRVETIKQTALAWSVGEASAQEIDELGILPATRLAFTRAIQASSLTPQYLLLDYIHWPSLSLAHQKFPKGENHSLSIAAASVLAKTTRDARMVELDAAYPGYGLARHKGYGTAIHQQAIRNLGLADIHRRSFKIA